MEAILWPIVWIPKIALVATPFVLVAFSSAARGFRKGLWVAAFVVAYYIAPIPAYIYAQDRLIVGEPIDWDAFMTASNLEYVCTVAAFWLIYLIFRVATRNTKRNDRSDAEAV